MSVEKHYLKVFITHAQADTSEAILLYDYLKSFGIDCWLSEKNLLPGQNRHIEITKQLKTSDVVLALISNHSQASIGQHQSEFKFALDMALERSFGSIFIIPIRLEKCSLPLTLEYIHTVDLFDAEAYPDLIKALTLRANELQKFLHPTKQTLTNEQFHRPSQYTYKLLKVLHGHSRWVTSVKFSREGKTLVSGGFDRRIRLWDVSSKKVSAILEANTGWLRSLAFSPDGQLLAAVSDDKMARLWHFSSQKLTQVFNMEGLLPGWAGDVVFSNKGEFLATTRGNSNIQLWRLSDNCKLHQLTHPNQRLMDKIIMPTMTTYSMVFSPDDTILVVATSDNVIDLWRIADGVLIKQVNQHKDYVYAVAFSPDGKLLASASKDETVKLWQWPNLSLVYSFEGHIDGAMSLAFSPDGKLLAVGSGHASSKANNSLIRIWDLETRNLVDVLKGQEKGINCVDFSPDGRLLASCSNDSTIYLWERT